MGARPCVLTIQTNHPGRNLVPKHKTIKFDIVGEWYSTSTKWFFVYLIPDWIEIWNVGFWGEGKTGVPGEKPSKQRRQPTTNSTHIWRRCRDLNLGHIGGGWVLSLLHNHWLPKPPFKGHLPFSKCDWPQKGLTCLSSHWLQLRKRSLTELSHLNRCTTFVNSTYNIAEIIKLMIIFYVFFVG